MQYKNYRSLKNNNFEVFMAKNKTLKNFLYDITSNSEHEEWPAKLGSFFLAFKLISWQEIWVLDFG
jgi:hypothetical protein